MRFQAWRRSVSAVLFVTAAAKFFGLVYGAPLLANTVPGTGVTFRQLVTIAASMEIALGVYTLLGRKDIFVAIGVLGFSLCAIGYRLMFLPPGSICPCFGGVSHWWHWLEQHEHQVLSVTLAWLTITSTGIILYNIRRQ